MQRQSGKNLIEDSSEAEWEKMRKQITLADFSHAERKV